ncbi:Regulation of nuclear pre-mRNA domain-containing protein 1A [Kappamyces sp. JEL0829]|nr:Regulation of nuclear pre-mRNA domain-containing protein 1A [Kappamyces sp. JEL0829]
MPEPVWKPGQTMYFMWVLQSPHGSLNSCLASRKIFYLYLCNDVLQESKKKGQDFIMEFQRVLPKVLETQFKFVSDDVRGKVKRILAVWRERRVYPEDFIVQLEEKAGLRGGHVSPDGSPSLSSPVGSPALPPNLKGIANSLNSLTALEASKLGAVTRVNAIRSSLYLTNSFDSVNDKSDLEKGAGEITDALTCIHSFEQIIASEIKARQKIIQDLALITQEQEAQLEILTGQQENMKEKTESLQAVAQEILNKIALSDSFHDSPFAHDPPMASLGGFVGSSAGQHGDARLQAGINPATLERISLGNWQADSNDFEL